MKLKNYMNINNAVTDMVYYNIIFINSSVIVMLNFGLVFYQSV